MPYVNVSWNVKASKEEKMDFMNFIKDTIYDVTATDRNRIYVFIREYDEENVSNVNCPVIKIDWVDIPNRTPEAKAEITKRIQTRTAEFPNVISERILVLFADVPSYNAKIGI